MNLSLKSEYLKYIVVSKSFIEVHSSNGDFNFSIKAFEIFIFNLSNENFS